MFRHMRRQRSQYARALGFIPNRLDGNPQLRELVL